MDDSFVIPAATTPFFYCKWMRYLGLVSSERNSWGGTAHATHHIAATWPDTSHPQGP
jgi:hypothetical protein